VQFNNLLVYSLQLDNIFFLFYASKMACQELELLAVKMTVKKGF